MGREEDTARRFVHVVPGPPDPLDPARHRERRADLDHQVDGAHVDPQLQRAGRHDPRQATLLERLLDDETLLAGHRAVVGAHQLLAGELVEAVGKPFGEPAAVDEDDRAPVGPDQLEDPWLDRRPDARPPLWLGSGPAGRRLGCDRLAGAAHLLDRHDHLELQGLAHPGIDDGDRARRGGGLPDRHAGRQLASTQEGGDRFERALGRGKADPLRPPSAMSATCGGRSASASSRSRERARWAPRLVPARAWISSTITHSTLRSVCRAAEVRMR